MFASASRARSGSRSNEVQPDAGLHGDLAQRVGEHVVQLARDAGPLLLLARELRRSAS